MACDFISEAKKTLNVLSLLCLATPSLAHADVFHNSNILVGDRAIGLGGAYAGVSDDASGVHYNPAGLAFALTNDVSGSANAYYSKKTVYKKAIGNSNFEERSEGLTPSFFGGMQKLDAIWEGFSAGFAIYSTDNELKDQNDLLLNPTADIKSFHRTANVRASTLNAGVAVAKMLHPRFSIGLSAIFVNVDELTQSYQDSVISLGDRLKIKDSAKGPALQVTAQNVRERFVSRSVQPTLGMQFSAFQSLSFGLAVRYPFTITESYNGDIDNTVYLRFADFSPVRNEDIVPDPNDPDKYKRIDYVVRTTPTETNTGGKLGTTRSDVSLGGLPMGVRGGVAWFASTRLLWTLDVDHSFAAEDGRRDYWRQAVTNVATGIEYFVLPTFPVRFGLFSNRDARPEVKAGEFNWQPEHIDYYGSTLFFGLAQENSHISGGVVYQLGKGQAQKIQGSTTLQNIEGYIVTGVFMASHSF